MYIYTSFSCLAKNLSDSWKPHNRYFHTMYRGPIFYISSCLTDNDVDALHFAAFFVQDLWHQMCIRNVGKYQSGMERSKIVFFFGKICILFGPDFIAKWGMARRGSCFGASWVSLNFGSRILCSLKNWGLPWRVKRPHRVAVAQKSFFWP